MAASDEKATLTPQSSARDFEQYGCAVLDARLPTKLVTEARSRIMCEYLYIQHLQDTKVIKLSHIIRKTKKKPKTPVQYEEVVLRGDPNRYDITLHCYKETTQHWLAPFQKCWEPQLKRLCFSDETEDKDRKFFHIKATFMVTHPNEGRSKQHKDQKFHSDSGQISLVNVFSPMIDMRPEYGGTEFVLAKKYYRNVIVEGTREAKLSAMETEKFGLEHKRVAPMMGAGGVGVFRQTVLHRGLMNRSDESPVIRPVMFVEYSTDEQVDNSENYARSERLPSIVWNPRNTDGEYDFSRLRMQDLVSSANFKLIDAKTKRVIDVAAALPSIDMRETLASLMCEAFLLQKPSLDASERVTSLNASAVTEYVRRAPTSSTTFSGTFTAEGLQLLNKAVQSCLANFQMGLLTDHRSNSPVAMVRVTLSDGIVRRHQIVQKIREGTSLEREKIIWESKLVPTTNSEFHYLDVLHVTRVYTGMHTIDMASLQFLFVAHFIQSKFIADSQEFPAATSFALSTIESFLHKTLEKCEAVVVRGHFAQAHLQFLRRPKKACTIEVVDINDNHTSQPIMPMEHITLASAKGTRVFDMSRDNPTLYALSTILPELAPLEHVSCYYPTRLMLDGSLFYRCICTVFPPLMFLNALGESYRRGHTSVESVVSRVLKFVMHWELAVCEAVAVWEERRPGRSAEKDTGICLYVPVRDFVKGQGPWTQTVLLMLMKVLYFCCESVQVTWVYVIANQTDFGMTPVIRRALTEVTDAMKDARITEVITNEVRNALALAQASDAVRPSSLKKSLTSSSSE